MSKRGDNIHKRKDGRWEGRYKIGSHENGNTKYKSVYGKTYSEVKKKLLEYQTATVLKLPKQLRKESFSEIIYLWMENNKLRHKKATEHKYLYLIEKHIIPEIGNIPISQINSATINSFLDKKVSTGRLDKKGGLSVSYVKTMSFIIQSALNYAVQENLCAPLNTSISKPLIRKKERKILSKKEQQIFEAYLGNEIDATRLGVLICLHAGLRIGEVCALTWNDIDISNRIIHIRHTISRVRDEKNNTTSSTVLVVETPKTQSSARDIPISSVLLPHLIKMESTAPSRYILSDCNTFLSPRTLEYRFKKLINNSGIDSINFHALRHTFATRCIEAGVDIKSLSEILGHANVGITLNTYVHSSMDLKHQQIEKLANYII